MKYVLLLAFIALNTSLIGQVELTRSSSYPAKAHSLKQYGVEIREAYWEGNIYHLSLWANVLDNEQHKQEVKFSGAELDVCFKVNSLDGDYAYAKAIVRRFDYEISGINTKEFKLRFNGQRQGSFPNYKAKKVEPEIILHPLPPDPPPVEPEPEFEEEIIEFVDTPPLFMNSTNLLNSNSLMMKFVMEHIKYPPIALESEIQGKVYVSFVVEPDGNVSNIKILKTPHISLSKEAIRVIKKFPKYKPGTARGRKVRSKQTIPIQFKIKD
jgi:TonB family protein